MTITNFPKPITPDVGGTKDFSFIETDLVPQIPLPISNEITANLTLAPGATVKAGYASPFSYQFDLKPDQEPFPNYYNFVLSGFYPEISKNILSLFESMKQKSFIVIATDNNKKQRLVGNELTPLFFNYVEVNGLNVPNKKGLQYQFFGALLKPPPFFKPVSPLTAQHKAITLQ